MSALEIAVNIFKRSKHKGKTLLPLRIGYGRAADLIVPGQVFGALRAVKLGLAAS